MAGLGDLFITVGANIDGFKQKMGTVNDALVAADQQAGRTSAGWSTMFSSLTTLGVGLTTAVSAPMLAVGAAGVAVSEQLTQASNAFTTMLGSAQSAGAFLNDLKAFAAATPFEFPDLVTAAQRMMAMGTAAGEVIPQLRTIGDAAAALGGGAPMVDRITTALGQMGAKGKVSAQEMNQLAEQGIPAWELLASRIGTSIPAAMQLAESGAISASVAIPAILDGMNEKFGGSMATAAKTLTGIWSNFKDQATFALGEIGSTLAPILGTVVTTIGLPMITFVKNMVDGFTSLPTPVQNAALAIGAMAVAAGPLLLAAGALGSAFVGLNGALVTLAPLFPSLAGGLAGIALPAAGTIAAVAGVTAALVALGTWVSANWEPIKATVSAAWDGITELWGAVWTSITGALSAAWSSIATAAEPIWTPIKDFVSGIWGGVSGAFSSAWSGISSLLSGVWNGIKSLAETAWGAITTALGSFMDIVAKIPGAAKLMNLDEVWKASKAGAAAMAGLAKSTTEQKNAAKDATEHHAKLSGVIGDAVTKKSEAARAASDLAAAIKLVGTDSDSGKTRIDNMRAAVNTITLAWLNGKVPLETYSKAIFNLNEEVKKEKIKDLEQKVKDLDKAYKDGLISTDEYSAGAGRLRTEITSLQGAVTTAMPSAAAMAEQVTKLHNEIIGTKTVMSNSETAATLFNTAMAGIDMKPPIAEIDRLEAECTSLPTTVKTGLTTAKGHVDTFATDVTSAFSTFSTDVIDALFGEKSFGKAWSTLMGNLKSALTDAFITPATTALNDFLNGVIADLLGGKGFGGILGKLGDIGESITGIFGSVGGAAASAGAGAAGTAAGGAGGAGSAAAGGVMGTLGAIGSLGSMVTGIIGNFQNARQETTLNAIEESTRHTKILTDQTKTDHWTREKNLLLKLDDLWNELKAIHTNITGGVFEKLDWITQVGRDQLALLSRDMLGVQRMQLAAVQNLTVNVAEFTASMRAENRPNLTINITGTLEPDDIAEKVFEAVQRRGVAK